MIYLLLKFFAVAAIITLNTSMVGIASTPLSSPLSSSSAFSLGSSIATVAAPLRSNSPAFSLGSSPVAGEEETPVSSKLSTTVVVGEETPVSSKLSTTVAPGEETPVSSKLSTTVAPGEENDLIGAIDRTYQPKFPPRDPIQKLAFSIPSKEKLAEEVSSIKEFIYKEDRQINIYLLCNKQLEFPERSCSLREFLDIAIKGKVHIEDITIGRDYKYTLLFLKSLLKASKREDLIDTRLFPTQLWFEYDSRKYDVDFITTLTDLKDSIYAKSDTMHILKIFVRLNNLENKISRSIYDTDLNVGEQKVFETNGRLERPERVQVLNAKHNFSFLDITIV